MPQPDSPPNPVVVGENIDDSGVTSAKVDAEVTTPMKDPSTEETSVGASKNTDGMALPGDATSAGTAAENIDVEEPTAPSMEDTKDATADHVKDGSVDSSAAKSQDESPALASEQPQPEQLDRPSTPTSKEKPVRDSEASDAMSASMATIKPTPINDKSTQYLTTEAPSYVDPTPSTPMTSQPPSRSPSNAAKSNHSRDHSPSKTNTEDDDKTYASEDDREGVSRSEIQSIMQQFSEFGGGPGADEVMSPRLGMTSPIQGGSMLGGSMQHPPRKSSLEPLSTNIASQLQDLSPLRATTSSPTTMRTQDRSRDDFGPPVPPKDGSFGTPPRPREDRSSSIIASPTSPPLSMHRLPPPEPEPEPTLPFDFHRFLEQLRNKKADPVARYLKSFLSEFGKRQWMVHEQVKIISDFLAFIANKMMQCEVWRDVPDAEFDNAHEGMEKLVMNRLYAQSFSPAIAPPKPIPGAKPKRKGGDTPLGPGRRGQHQEDVERDDIVTQKINIYGWVKEEHLDIPAVGDSGRRFLKLAQQELLKIKSYRAPRDKIICVLNCSKVIFGLLKHNKSDSSADSFMPLLIYVVLQSNPEHLVSNVQYILRFRNQDKLGGEAGYYLSSLMGAIQFIENMDRSSLTISDDEFEKNVEAAVSAIAERHQALSPKTPQQPTFNEKSSLQGGESGLRPSMDGSETGGPRRSTSSNEGDANDGAAISGLLRTIQKPLTTIGRIFSDEAGSSSSAPAMPPRPSASAHHPSPRTSGEEHHRHSSLAAAPADLGDGAGDQASFKHSLSAEEAAARQASAESAEAQRLQRAEHSNVVETLAGMFPDLDKDVISDVVYQKEGRVGLAVDACLALSS